MDLESLDENRFLIRKDASKGMNTDVIVYSDGKMIEKIKSDRTLQQAANATTLPALAGSILVMPDGHEGYGFPIGGVMASYAESGFVSPGAVGFDINCGIRLIKTNLVTQDVRPKINELSDRLFKNVPSGVGSRLNIGLKPADLSRVAEEGVEYIVDKGFGVPADTGFIEEAGCMEGADLSKVSSQARSRGLNELGTLGAGNHFLEVQRVEKILDGSIAARFGLSDDQVVIMVHTGSRGFGHQICSDYLKILVEYQRRQGITLADPELSYAYVGTKEATDYLLAMKSAVNYAFVNRQIITSSIRRSFEETFGRSWDAMGMEILYDLSHNIVKLEEHKVDGKLEKLLVHRKGATRAFSKGRPELPRSYRETGQPVLIPGSMGTASYVLCGTEGAMKETFGSACHGAGRVMSRHEAIRTIPASKTFASMQSKGIAIRIRTRKLVSEEAEWTYKDIDDVVSVVQNAGIAKAVSRNVPLAVIKG
ncbi:MAG: RtcB family protein [Candidatus Micrarchaeota archaeon]|nr:RtcB family protein [Candidatus Micrarchaeota archaeon]